MMKKLLVLITIAALLALEFPQVARADAWPAKSSHAVTLLPDGLSVVWQSAEPQAARLPDGSHAVQMAGFGMEATPGLPQLPVDTLLVALPPGPAPTWVVDSQASIQRALPGTIDPVPAAIAVPGEADRELTDLLPTLRSSAQTPVTLQEIGIARGVRLARLVFHPVQVIGEGLTVIRSLKVTLRFGSTRPALAAQDAGASSDPYLNQLLSEVVNPAQVQTESLVSAALSSSISSRAGQAVIEVAKPGLTAVSYEVLAAAGYPVGSVNPLNFHLMRNSVEIPTEWNGDGDALFEAGEQLLFYAQPRFSRWTANDVYYLSANATTGLLIGGRDVVPAGKPAGSLWVDQVFEQNAIYTPDCYCAPIPAGRDGDRWVWDVLRQPDRASASYTLSLAQADSTQPARLSLWLIGYTAIDLAPDHRVEVRLNGTLLGTVEFDGKQAVQTDLTIPAGILTSTSNTLNLSLPGVGSLVEGVWLDAVALHYARNTSAVSGIQLVSGDAAASQYALAVGAVSGLRAYDITDPDLPVRLQNAAVNAGWVTLADPQGSVTSHHYAVIPDGAVLTPVAIHMAAAPAQPAGANEIIITPKDFAADLTDLVALRQSQGISVAVEDVGAIYDAYDGRAQPEAIQAFIKEAYQTWNPKPSYVLLVGDGTSDPRNYRQDSTRTWIPPYLVDADPVIGEIAADNRYVSVDGDDNLPDLWIGRLPVNSHVEAAITLTKIVQYDRAPVPGAWSRRMLLIGDKLDATAGDFPAEIAALKSTYQNSRYAINDLTYNNSTDQADFHQAVLGQWNQGNSIILYTGHGSTQQWGAEVFFHINDLPSLTNGSRLPVLLDMTCLTGSFQLPNLPTLDETLLRRSGKGAAAVLGSTGLGLSSGHMLLADGFLDQVMADSKSSLGKAVQQGKLNLAASAPVLGYLLDTYTLFGDPAMKLNYRYDAYLPSAAR
jgi:hypothetical protein